MSDRNDPRYDDGELTPALRGGNGSADLRIKKLLQPQMVRVAADHNKRANWCHWLEHQVRQGDGSDPQNECLWGPTDPRDVAKHAAKLRIDAGIDKIRKNGVHMIEVVVSLRPGSCQDDRTFFEQALNWLADNFCGRSNLLSADVHRDEGAPHMHVLILPLVDGKMLGSDMVGSIGKLRALRSRFDKQVCRPHGLAMPVENLRGGGRTQASEAVLRQIERQGDVVTASSIWWAVKESIHRDPRLFLQALDIDVASFLPNRKLRNSTSIFISKGKGPQRLRQGDRY